MTIKQTRFGSYDTEWKSPWEIKVREEVEKYDLADCTREFFRILDIKEVSDEGREFSPNYISSCRALDGAKLGMLITKMKKLAENDTSPTD